MSSQLYQLINIVGAYSLIISFFLVAKDRKTIQGAYATLLFLICLIIYLLIGFVHHPIVHDMLLIGPFLIPLSFWLMARSFFNDQPFQFRKLLILILATTVVYYSLYYGIFYSSLEKILAIGIRLLSLIFIILAFIEAQSGRKIDLDEKRLRLRKYFTFLIGLIALITILSELALTETEGEWPRVVQRSAILITNTLFILSNFSLKSSLFDTKKKESVIKHPELIDEIQKKMVVDGFFQKEQLTIGELAAAIGEQEYRVRRAINQELGYRNFIDFTNSFRIKAATEILKDPSKANLTILEIAYQTGFNSIGPFNRSFKQTTGLTPTEFRNNHIRK